MSISIKIYSFSHITLFPSSIHSDAPLLFIFGQSTSHWMRIECQQTFFFSWKNTNSRSDTIYLHWAQLFTSWIEYFCLNVNISFAFSIFLNETYLRRKCSIKTLVSYNLEDLYLLFFFFGLMHQYLKGAIPSTKWRNSVFVLLEIFHLWIR